MRMMHSMSAIGWLETTTFSPVVWARNFGLKQVENQTVLKDAFMAQANGLSILKDTRLRSLGQSQIFLDSRINKVTILIKKDTIF